MFFLISSTVAKCTKGKMPEVTKNKHKNTARVDSPNSTRNGPIKCTHEEVIKPRKGKLLSDES